VPSALWDELAAAAAAAVFVAGLSSAAWEGFQIVSAVASGVLLVGWGLAAVAFVAAAESTAPACLWQFAHGQPHLL
jgi:hypothetical protein